MTFALMAITVNGGMTCWFWTFKVPESQVSWSSSFQRKVRLVGLYLRGCFLIKSIPKMAGSAKCRIMKNGCWIVFLPIDRGMLNFPKTFSCWPPAALNFLVWSGLGKKALGQICWNSSSLRQHTSAPVS